MSRTNNMLIHDTTELRKLILENPDLPIVVLADGETSCADDSMWWYQSDVKCHKGIMLDYDLEWTDRTYDDETDFEEDLAEYLYDEHDDLTEFQLEEFVKEKLKEYEPYWRDVIVVKVGN